MSFDHINLNNKEFQIYNKSITANIIKLSQIAEEINETYNPSKLLELNPNDIKALDGTLSRINMACADVKRLLLY